MYMTDQLIPPQVLDGADRILFVAHLALGDFTYMESCFKAFHNNYPHIKIDIWVDELRRTYDFRQWAGLKKYSLFDWLEVSPYFDTIYKKTYSPFAFRSSVREARAKNYPIVISFGLSRRTFYAGLVHKLAPKAFTAAIIKRYKSYDFMKRRVFGRLSASLVDYPEGATHVSDIYAAWFHSLFGLNISREDRYPQLTIPDAWRTDACKRLFQWGLSEKVRRKNRLVFVNAFSKQDERSWSVEKALELIAAIQCLDGWRGSDFVINTVPEKWIETKQTLERVNVKSNVFLFSAGDNFFQLPAILEQCDLIISVETAVMHLANAVNVPVIALMRQLTPEWMPIDKENSRVVMTEGRDDWVQKITLGRVIDALPDVQTMQWRAV
jgi:ADP-heptose:LPS heptosyltransferase